MRRCLKSFLSLHCIYPRDPPSRTSPRRSFWPLPISTFVVPLRRKVCAYYKTSLPRAHAISTQNCNKGEERGGGKFRQFSDVLGALLSSMIPNFNMGREAAMCSIVDKSYTWRKLLTFVCCAVCVQLCILAIGRAAVLVVARGQNRKSMRCCCGYCHHCMARTHTRAFSMKFLFNLQPPFVCVYT